MDGEYSPHPEEMLDLPVLDLREESLNTENNFRAKYIGFLTRQSELLSIDGEEWPVLIASPLYPLVRRPAKALIDTLIRHAGRENGQGTS